MKSGLKCQHDAIDDMNMLFTKFFLVFKKKITFAANFEINQLPKLKRNYVKSVRDRFHCNSRFV